MKRKDYKNYVWYDLTDDEYWVEEWPDEFPNCQTVVIDTRNKFDECYHVLSQSQAYMGWGTMAKYGDWKFMIIEKP